MTRFNPSHRMSMNPYPYAAAVLALCAAINVGCSSDSSHPSLISTTSGGADAQAQGGRAGSHEGGAASSAAGSNDAGSSGANENAGGGDDDAGSGGSGTGSGGHGPTTPSTCDPTTKWASPESVDQVSSGAAETLLSVTPDELDLAFLRGGALYVAHRESATGTFDVGAAVTIPTGWTATEGAALSADGKRLVLLGDPAAVKFGELVRSSRSVAFSGAIDETAFSAVNQDAEYTGKVYAAPLVSSGDDQLFFNSAFPNGASTIVTSARTGGGAWSAPRQLTALAFDRDVGKRCLPTGISADTRTLFYFDEGSMLEEARFRPESIPSSPWYDVTNLGTRRGATPNSACNRLYSGSNGDVVAEKD